jgi:hypothetical protein
VLAGLGPGDCSGRARLHTKIHADLTIVRSAWIFSRCPTGLIRRETELAAVDYRAYHAAQAYAMWMPPWRWE